VIALPLPKPVGYRFADLLLDLRRRQLSRGDETIRLGKLSYDMLRTLVEQAPSIVTREELAERVWRGRYVSPETLTQRIKLLRRALSDAARAPRYIAAVRGLGYRVAPAVQPVTEKGRRPVLAVLPFDVLSNEPDSELFVAGMHEEIVSRMTRVSALDVRMSPTVKRHERSGEPISRLATELGANAVIKGSIRYAANRVRIAAQLIDVVSSAHLWADVFDCDRGDELEIQAYVAHEIANAIAGGGHIAQRSRVADVRLKH
jgi:TolB-like protein